MKTLFSPNPTVKKIGTLKSKDREGERVRDPQTDGGLGPTRTPPTKPDHNFLPQRPCTRLSKSPGNDPRSVVSSGLCGRRETTALRDALGRVIAWRQAGVTVIVEDVLGVLKKIRVF